MIVVHCKAGKGRSGTASCSYLVSEEGWKMADAIKRFSERRMRPGWGEGVSIPSQRRWLTYVERWTDHGKLYVERKVEIVELQVTGLRDGVKFEIHGFVDEGKRIKSFHSFDKSERTITGGELNSSSWANAMMEVVGMKSKSVTNLPLMAGKASSGTSTPTGKEDSSSKNIEAGSETSLPIKAGAAANTAGTSAGEARTVGADAIFRPKDSQVILPTSDICIDIERRTKGSYTWPVLTSIAHVWFNVFFEGNGPEQGGKSDDSGVFGIEWDAMDGLKGSSQKGTRAFDRLAVVWKASENKQVVREPAEGEAVAQSQPADWHGTEDVNASDEEDEGVQSHGA